MNTENICKALYALPGGVVAPRKESVKTPIVLAIIGVAFLIINSTVLSDTADALSMTLLCAGIALIIYGIIAVMMRLNSSRRVPYDNEARSYMRYRERYYDRELVAALRRAIADGDIEAIDSMPTTNIAAVTLIEYRSSHRRAYGLYEYGEAEYRPLSEPNIINK